MQWRVGDGKSIKIYSDRWLPRPSSFSIVSQPILGVEVTVDSLFSPSGGWNSSLIKNNFRPDDAKSILQIPIGSRNQMDTRLRHYETGGNYSVRSGYWDDYGMETIPGTSSPGVLNQWWKKFWKLKLPAKVKIFFLWRAYHDWIPTKFNIAGRGIQLDGYCATCKTSTETT
ncbi:hypothetical protein Ddye_001594 [Dipteronia dyeriana]|uniref:Reverse transcriptase zinc-binding domain-containing protein n=1 Tax=Dipteronia dyeriana TaxID=168575 RepID=A0AAD9XPJ3_9ROSI|nr:hypothetical protein Ddye_001594 [Dipteronia dyeriana]